MWLLVFTVEGSDTFPYDMLRYDSCYPRSQDDVTNMATPQSARQVTLNTTGWSRLSAKVTMARWESFGWKVVSQEPPRKLPAL